MIKAFFNLIYFKREWKNIEFRKLRKGRNKNKVNWKIYLLKFNTELIIISQAIMCFNLKNGFQFYIGLKGVCRPLCPLLLYLLKLGENERERQYVCVCVCMCACVCACVCVYVCVSQSETLELVFYRERERKREKYRGTVFVSENKGKKK